MSRVVLSVCSMATAVGLTVGSGAVAQSQEGSGDVYCSLQLAHTNQSAKSHAPQLVESKSTKKAPLLGDQGSWLLDVGAKLGDLSWDSIDDALEQQFGVKYKGGSRSGIAIGTIASAASDAKDGNFEGVVKDVAAGFVGFLGTVNPLLGLFGGIVLSLFPGAASTSDKLEKALLHLKDEILAETKDMIKENNLLLMKAAARAAFNQIDYTINQEFQRDYENKSSKKKCSAWEKLRDKCQAGIDGAFAGENSNCIKTPYSNGLDFSSKDCQDWYGQGQFLRQLTFAGLHLSTHMMMAATCDADDRSDYTSNLHRDADMYHKMLSDSLHGWGNYAVQANKYKCSYDKAYTHEKKNIDLHHGRSFEMTARRELNVIHDTWLTGVRISKLVGCTPYIDVKSSCRMCTPTTAYKNCNELFKDCTFSTDPCSITKPDKRHGGKCPRQSGLGMGECSMTKSKVGNMSCDRNYMDAFSPIWAKRLQGLFAQDLENLMNIKLLTG